MWKKVGWRGKAVTTLVRTRKATKETQETESIKGKLLLDVSRASDKTPPSSWHQQAERGSSYLRANGANRWKDTGFYCAHA